MPLVLTILTFAFFIAVGYVSNYVKKRFLLKPVLEGTVSPNKDVMREFAIQRRVAILPALEKETIRVEGYAVPESLYYHQGHAWVAPQDSETALIGIDEFAAKFVGPPASVCLPPVGETFRQGEKGWRLEKEDSSIGMIFPIDGKVIAVNEQVKQEPGLVTREPYGKGWLVMVESRNLRRNLRNLLKGAVARRWTEESASELRSLFSRRLGIVFPDGGLPEDGVADYVSAEEWQEFARRTFLLE